MSDGMGRELAYLSSHATNRYFIPNWGKVLENAPTKLKVTVNVNDADWQKIQELFAKERQWMNSEMQMHIREVNSMFADERKKVRERYKEYDGCYRDNNSNRLTLSANLMLGSNSSISCIVLCNYHSNTSCNHKIPIVKKNQKNHWA